MKIVKNKALLAFFFFSVLLITFYKVTYHVDSYNGIKSIVKPEEVVEEARKLTGIVYDPVQGRFSNIGGRLGFIVCMDVPVISYSNAGFSIKDALDKDYKVH